MGDFSDDPLLRRLAVKLQRALSKPKLPLTLCPQAGRKRGEGTGRKFYSFHSSTEFDSHHLIRQPRQLHAQASVLPDRPDSRHR